MKCVRTVRYVQSQGVDNNNAMVLNCSQYDGLKHFYIVPNDVIKSLLTTEKKTAKP